MRSLCQRRAVASTAPSGQGTTSSCFPTSASRTLAPTRPAIRRRSRLTSPRPSRRNRSSCKSARPTGSSRKAAPRCRATSTPKSGREAHDQRRGHATGVQDLQVHHRSHRRPKASTRANCARYAPNPTCPVHHPKKRPQQVADDAKWKAEQEKQRRETAIANTTGIRTLAAITAAVPVRLMKRDLLSSSRALLPIMDENLVWRCLPGSMASGRSGRRRVCGTIACGAFSVMPTRASSGRALVEIAILLARGRVGTAATVLRDAPRRPTKWIPMPSRSR